MRNPVQLSLVIHNHQPVGNFDAVIDEACNLAYIPFLKALLEYPKIRLGLHTSGCLLEWLQHHRSEYFELVRELVKRNQLELLGGGMYEPILPVLTRCDAHYQLVRLSEYIEEHFGQRPVGMWCPERVWEPHLPPILAEAGLTYTLLDDFHFRSSALPNQITREYFTTEHEGKLFSLLPISKELRYTIPFQPLKSTLDYLADIADADESSTPPLVVFGDDGEKFGVWPDTHEWVYERGWLKEFFTGLTENLDWIDLKLPGEIVKTRQPGGKVFIPCASYMEMGQWTRIDPDAEEDDPPGFWRNYMHKYPAANQMYRKMLYVSNLIAQPEASSSPSFSSAKANLGRGQCNCSYWHGIFGGLYLNYLRHAVYYHLLKAELEIERNTTLIQRPALVKTDHDGLGWDQVLVRGSDFDALIDPGHGFCLSRLDYLPTKYCWSNLIARRREAYHKLVHKAVLKEEDRGHESIHDRILAKERGLEQKLVFDSYPRSSFITYFSSLNNLESLIEVPNTPEKTFQAKHIDFFSESVKIALNSTMVKGIVKHDGFTIEKSAQITSHGLELRAKLVDGRLPVETGLFCVEFNFTLLTDQSDERKMLVNGTQVSLTQLSINENSQSIELKDNWQKCTLKLNSPLNFRAICYPVKTVSSSEGGFELTYQGSCMILAFHPLALQEGFSINLDILEN